MRIFRANLKNNLLHGECVLTDGGYRDERCKTQLSSKTAQFTAAVRARHEIVNRRLKKFRVLGDRFRHSVQKHSICFHAVANVTEVSIERGELLFDL